MEKKDLLAAIVAQLKADHDTYFEGAKAAHEAAMNDENIPDNKYETLSLEASYLAQGQANRAEEIRATLKIFENLPLVKFGEDSPVALGAWVQLESEQDEEMWIFIAPRAGGLTLEACGVTTTLVSPGSPIGGALVGKLLGDSIELMTRKEMLEWEIMQVL